MYKVFFSFFPRISLRVASLNVCVCLCNVCACLDILCQYACFEHNESIKFFFFSPVMSKKEQQKVGLCKKFFFHRRRSKTGKKEAFAKKGKKKEPLKEIKKQLWDPSLSHPIFRRVSSRIKGPPSSFMICSRARSLCTFTALVEIRCCGPSSCNRETGRGGERRRRRVDSVRLQQIRSGVAGSWLSHRLTGTANSMRNRRGRQRRAGAGGRWGTRKKKKRRRMCQSKPSNKWC